MADAPSVVELRSGRRPPRFATLVVVGGGCYGEYYVRQLRRAIAAGALAIDRVVVVDRDPLCRVATATPDVRTPVHLAVAEWSAWFASYLGAAANDPATAARDAIVPSPLMPHLTFEWLVARIRARDPRARVVHAPLPDAVAVPWQRAGADGTHYVSYATWMCPINCVEPVRCPHTRGARDWTMPAAIADYAAGARVAGRDVAGPYVFHCTHRAYGVGMIDVRDVLAADADLARARSAPFEALVGSVSHCHGAVGRVLVEPAGDA